MHWQPPKLRLKQIGQILELLGYGCIVVHRPAQARHADRDRQRGMKEATDLPLPLLRRLCRLLVRVGPLLALAFAPVILVA